MFILSYKYLVLYTFITIFLHLDTATAGIDIGDIGDAGGEGWGDSDLIIDEGRHDFQTTIALPKVLGTPSE